MLRNGTVGTTLNWACTCLVLGTLLVACSPLREAEPRWQRRPWPTPTPWRPPIEAWRPDGMSPELTPSPEGPLESPSPPTLAPTPNRRAMHDRTRDPLAWSISPRMPQHEAAARRLVDRARMEIDAGTAGRAFELLDEAIRLDPGCVPAYVLRARASLLVGSTEEARADLNRAVELNPKGAWLAEVVAVNGEVYEVEGNRDAAVAAYRRALGIFAPNRTAREALSQLLSR